MKLKLNKGFLEVRSVTRNPEDIVPAGHMPISDYFIVSKGSVKYPEGTEVILDGTSVLHKLGNGNYVLRETDIIGKYE